MQSSSVIVHHIVHLRLRGAEHSIYQHHRETDKETSGNSDSEIANISNSF